MKTLVLSKAAGHVDDRPNLGDDGVSSVGLILIWVSMPFFYAEILKRTPVEVKQMTKGPLRAF